MGAQSTRLAVPEFKDHALRNTTTTLLPDEMSKWMVDCMRAQLEIDEAKTGGGAKADEAVVVETQPDAFKVVKAEAAKDSKKRKSTETDVLHQYDQYGEHDCKYRVTQTKRQRVEMPTILEEPEEY